MGRQLLNVYLALSVVLCFVVACENTPTPSISVGDTDTDSNEGGDADTDSDSEEDSDSDSDGDDDSDSASETESDTECGEADVSFETQTPTVVLLIDQSTSMDFDFDNGSRWEVLGETLFDVNTGIVKGYEETVRFGLSLYTSDDGNEGPVCPMIDGVAPALSNFNAIRQKYDAEEPDGDTPTGESISAVVDTLVADTHPDAKIIVLATDGEPDTCEDDSQTEFAQQVSVEAAEYAFSQDILLFIISVSDDISTEHMQEMANAGAGVQPGEPDAPYYQALDQAALGDAFEEIINGIRPCTLAVEGEIVAHLANECTVEIDGQSVIFDDPNG
ncbi:MAG: VWA domain-containing protein [Myxococcota bacterium]|nr:VWA domain-containing protein [Myxococcota bacterium]